MKKTKHVQVGRLAFRVEGDRWNAYYALPDTMDDAILLGHILLHLVDNPEVKSAFMDTMRAVMTALLKDITGTAPTWNDPERAPEHERAGRA